MAEDTREALRAVPLFTDLTDKDLDRVAAIAKKVQHAAGKAVVEEDQSAVGFHLILEGTAEASTGGTVVNTLEPGCLLRRDLLARRQAAIGHRHRHDRSHDARDPGVELQPAVG